MEAAIGREEKWWKRADGRGKEEGSEKERVGKGTGSE